MLCRHVVGSQRWGARLFGKSLPVSGGCLRPRERVYFISAPTLSVYEKSTQRQHASDDVALLKLCPSVRGLALQTATRQILADMYPHAVFEDAVPGLCANGVPRSQHMAEYDWLMDGRRVECKSSTLAWVPSAKTWSLSFHGIKAARKGVRAQSAFDELILSFCSPRRLYIYRHDSVYSCSTDGDYTFWRGQIIRLRGPRNEIDWQPAIQTIIAKLDSSRNGCEHIADVPLLDARISEAVRQASGLKHAAYADVPLSNLCPATRALRILEMAREVDAMLHPKASFMDPEPSRCSDGRTRGRGLGQQTYDWMRDGLRIECRSSGLSWDTTNQRWYARFVGIQFDRLDELNLAIWSPAGISLFRHNLNFGVSSHRLRSEWIGLSIQIVASRSDTDCLLALGSISQKLEDAGCPLVAHIRWT